MFDDVSLASKVICLRIKLVGTSFLFIKVPTQLSDEFTVTLVISSLLQGLILDHKVWGITSWFLLQVTDFPLKLISLGVKLSLKNFSLSFSLVEMFWKAINFGLLAIEFDPVARIDVFLNLHS